MPHIRIEPLKELEFLSQRLRKFTDEFPESFSFEIGKGFEPKVNVHHDSENVYVTAEIPGVPKDDIHISLKEDTLTLGGTKKPDMTSDDLVDSRLERAFGDFSRKIPLPCEVNHDAVSASFKDGVLKVVIGKKVVVQKSEVEIKIQ